MTEPVNQKSFDELVRRTAERRVRLQTLCLLLPSNDVEVAIIYVENLLKTKGNMIDYIEAVKR